VKTHAESVSRSGSCGGSADREGETEGKCPGGRQRRRGCRNQYTFRLLGGKSDSENPDIDRGHELRADIGDAILPARRLVLAGFLNTATAILAGLVVAVPRVFVVRAAEKFKSWHGSEPTMGGQWHPNQGHHKAHYSTERLHNKNW